MARSSPKSAEASEMIKRPGGARYSGASAWADPGPNGERLWVFDGPGSLVQYLAMLLSRHLNQEFQTRVGASMPVVRLLAALERLGPSTLKQLVAATGMDKAQVSRTMAGMVKSGYIDFSGPIDNPSRFTARTKAVLTRKGDLLVAEALTVAREHHVEVLQHFAPNERRTLYRLLRRMIEAAEAWGED